LQLPNLSGSPLSLQGWRGQPKQSREGYEIAAPRQVGARNDKKNRRAGIYFPPKGAAYKMPPYKMPGIKRKIEISQPQAGLER
jgi:hypothetical protein